MNSALRSTFIAVAPHDHYVVRRPPAATPGRRHLFPARIGSRRTARSSGGEPVRVSARGPARVRGQGRIARTPRRGAAVAAALRRQLGRARRRARRVARRRCSRRGAGARAQRRAAPPRHRRFQAGDGSGAGRVPRVGRARRAVLGVRGAARRRVRRAVTREPAWKRVLFWPAALLLLIPFGLVCFAFPIVRLVWMGHGTHLLDDTRAAYGAGTTEGVPRATSVRCSRSEAGSSGRRRIHSVEYDCEFALERTDLPPPRAPLDYTGMTPEEQQAAYEADLERFYAEVDAATAPPDPLDPPSTVERLLPTTAEGRPMP